MRLRWLFSSTSVRLTATAGFRMISGGRSFGEDEDELDVPRPGEGGEGGEMHGGLPARAAAEEWCVIARGCSGRSLFPHRLEPHERVHESMSIAGKCAVCRRSSSASSHLVWTETLSSTAGWPLADLVMSVNEVCSAGRS